MPQDKFANVDSVTAPARECFSVVPNDNDDLVSIPKALYIGTGGDLVVRLLDNEQDVTFRNVPTGFILDVRPATVKSSGTTANDIVGLL